MVLALSESCECHAKLHKLCLSCQSKKKPALKGAGLIAVYQEVIPEIILVKNRILMVGESGK
ncbi:hypothetical protein MASR2M12_07810 [Bacteroidales bacterium]